MTTYADLHMHTQASDGVLSPKDLVDLAVQNGVKVIAITDHDTVAGIAEAILYAENRLMIIPSIELSCQYKGRDMHILGHFINYQSVQLQKKLLEFKMVREGRALEMIAKLKNLFQMTIDFQEIKENQKKGVIGRLHIARALVEKGYVQDTGEAFEKLIGEDAPAYVEKFKLSPDEAFALIKSFGGISYFAHPVRTGLLENIEELVAMGLEGLEIFHPSHLKADSDRILNLARRYGLKLSAGSDFHAPGVPNDLGSVGFTKKEYQKYIGATSKE